MDTYKMEEVATIHAEVFGGNKEVNVFPKADREFKDHTYFGIARDLQISPMIIAEIEAIEMDEGFIF